METPLDTKTVDFEISADAGSEVILTGTFNDWSPDSVVLNDRGGGHFGRSLSLPRGRHEYKFVVNGVWTADPDCPRWEPNAHGSLNSVIIVDH